MDQNLPLLCLQELRGTELVSELEGRDKQDLVTSTPPGLYQEKAETGQSEPSSRHEFLKNLAVDLWFYRL